MRWCGWRRAVWSNSIISEIFCYRFSFCFVCFVFLKKAGAASPGRSEAAESPSHLNADGGAERSPSAAQQWRPWPAWGGRGAAPPRPRAPQAGKAPRRRTGRPERWPRACGSGGCRHGAEGSGNVCGDRDPEGRTPALGVAGVPARSTGGGWGVLRQQCGRAGCLCSQRFKGALNSRGAGPWTCCQLSGAKWEKAKIPGGYE